ncbi:DUF927 domain-containing protein [Sinorhizobium meliloti]|uniref:DUF927 domain-containing protein n=1 Tax=Rhizobium meliloti TaxID=382 RepID=UPI003D65C3D3
MADTLEVDVFDQVTVEGAVEPFLCLSAKAGENRRVRIFLPATASGDLRRCEHELKKAGLRFYDDATLRRALRAAFKMVKPLPLKVVTTSGWHGRSYVLRGQIYREFASTEKLILHQGLLETRPPRHKAWDSRLIRFIGENGSKSDYLALAAMIAFAQPLLGLVKASERPVIYFWGQSRTGKTTLAKLIQALTLPKAADGSRPPLRSFQFTDRAFEEIMRDHCDSVVVLDEVGAVPDAELEAKLSTLIYTASNGTGKARSKGGDADAAYRDLSWRTTTVMTGEKDISQLRARRVGSGQDARLLSVSIPDREAGGIWTAHMSGDDREAMMNELTRLSDAHPSQHLPLFVFFLVRFQDEIKARYTANVGRIARHLAGDDTDSLIVAAAKKYAQLAAAGDELINFGLLDWDKDLPLQVVERLWATNGRAQPSNSARINEEVDYARRILMHVGSGTIGERAAAESGEVGYVCSRNGKRYVMIRKGELGRLLGADEGVVTTVFRRVSGLLTASGSTPYFQTRLPGGASGPRFVRLDFDVLTQLAAI